MTMRLSESLFVSLLIFAALLGFLTTVAKAGICPPMCVDDVTESKGVYCEINEVTLFALTEEDCKKAGGVVTHSITATVEPVEPEEAVEPEEK